MITNHSQTAWIKSSTPRKHLTAKPNMLPCKFRYSNPAFSSSFYNIDKKSSFQGPLL